MEQLLSLLRQRGLESIYISSIDNVRYISPYTGDEAYLLITEREKFLITDPRYTEQAQLECPDYTIVEWRRLGSVAAAVGELVKRHHISSVGYEDDRMTVRQFAQFQREVPAELVPAGGTVEKLRAVKRPEEIACLRAACDIACRAYERVLKDIRVGITEREIAARLSCYMVMEGADTRPYGGIVLAGARTSLLHGIPSSKAVEYGDLVLLDFGCQYHGYLSDMSRTVVVGRASPMQREVYDLERKMYEATLAAIRPGAAAREVYEQSTRPLEGSKYYPYHYNGIGHGVGLFVHETPFLSPTSDDVLERGNVMTVEPGIYIPGWGGIRIEDQVLLTDGGCENLMFSTRDLEEL